MYSMAESELRYPSQTAQGIGQRTSVRSAVKRGHELRRRANPGESPNTLSRRRVATNYFLSNLSTIALIRNPSAYSFKSAINDPIALPTLAISVIPSSANLALTFSSNSPSVI